MWLAEPKFSHDEDRRASGRRRSIIIGDADIVTPEHAVEMFRTIPRGAALRDTERGRHGVMPKEMVLTFLKESLAQSS